MGSMKACCHSQQSIVEKHCLADLRVVTILLESRVGRNSVSGTLSELEGLLYTVMLKGKQSQESTKGTPHGVPKPITRSDLHLLLHRGRVLTSANTVCLDCVAVVLLQRPRQQVWEPVWTQGLFLKVTNRSSSSGKRTCSHFVLTTLC